MKVKRRPSNSEGCCCFRVVKLRLVSLICLIGFALAALTLNEMAIPNVTLAQLHQRIDPHVKEYLPFLKQREQPTISYAAVGYKGCQNFMYNHEILSLLQEYTEENSIAPVRVKSVEIPTKKEFLSWLSTRHNAEQIPPYHVTSPVTFRTIGDKREFVGGVDELLELLAQAYPGLDLSSVKQRLAAWRESETAKKGLETPDEQLEVDDTSESQSLETETKTEKKRAHAIPGHSSRSKLKIPKLEKQISLRNNLIVTAYRKEEGKKVTNHKPLWQYIVKKYNYKFLFQAPVPASFIFVQDQSSAQLSVQKNKRAIINNIGWGGQSCYGGTKGAQMRCRMELAARDGCSYDSLKIQPPQYRLWIEEECTLFFQSTCIEEGAEERLWIEKPSGGQHGAGMSVHRGCEALKNKWGSCKKSFAKGKKFFVMEYIDPALLDGHKFDLRTYLVVASLDPFLIFYHDGFVRRAALPYTSDIKDPKAHITNSHAQDGAEDHFWDFDRLEKHLHQKNGFPADYITKNFRSHAMKVQNFVFQAARANMYRRKGSYQLFALDWIIDSKGGIHMLEANSNPLVTNYPIPGFPETWETMIDLILNIHTNPEVLGSDPMIARPRSERWKYFDWFLVFNENEEIARGETYNACKALENLNKHPFAADVLGDEPSLEEIQKKLVVEELSKEAEENENEEDSGAEESGAEESASELSTVTVSDALDQAIKTNGPTEAIDDTELEKFGCELIKDIHQVNETITRCMLGKGTPSESYFYIIEPVDKDAIKEGPTVLIVGGVHGNEGAGTVTARHVRRNWRPSKGRVVVASRVNPTGVKNNHRVIANAKEGKDLNRNFPDNLEVPPVGDIAKNIWEMVTSFKPHVFFDLHEGWGFYKMLKDNPHEKLVGNTKFSKGSSVISSPNAAPLAKAMIEAVNSKLVTDSQKEFLLIVPPVKNGLANRVTKTFGSLSIVQETTTKNQPLELRVRQQLVLLATAFEALGLFPGSRSVDTVLSEEIETCVAGRKPCTLEHPGDTLLINR